MASVGSWLLTDRGLAIAGVTGTMLFGVLSIIFFVRSRRFRRLAAIWSSSVLLARKHPDVHILFRSEEVENVARLRVMFVNAGTEPITRKDLAATTANRITFKPKPSATKLLSAACVAGDVGVCGAACVIVNENAEFTFEYLNPGHKIVVEVLYTGAMPDIHGQMVGGKIRTERHLQFHPIIEIFSLVGTYALAAAALLIPIGLFWLFQKLNVPFSRLLALITLVTFTVPAIIIGGPRLQRLTRAFTERREARTLEKYLVE